MRFFYVTSVKRFVLTGAVLGIIAGILMRFFIKDFAAQEVIFHSTLRTRLGNPFAYYSQSAIALLTLIFAYYYAVLGGICGYLCFRFKHRHSGFTLFFTRAFKVTSVITLIALSFLFVRVDLINPYDAKIMAAMPHPTASQILPAKFLKTLAYLFLPSLTAAPERGFPKAQQSAAERDAAANTTPQTQPVNNPPVAPIKEQPAAPIIPLPTANTTTTLPKAGLPSGREIFDALNVYRGSNSVQQLLWDRSLADYAQTRANYYASRGSIDGSAGFRTFVGQNGPFALAFHDLGELSNYGVSDTAQGLIVSYWGAYPATRSEELKPDWLYAGVGVNGTAVDIIFATRKCGKVERGQCY